MKLWAFSPWASTRPSVTNSGYGTTSAGGNEAYSRARVSPPHRSRSRCCGRPRLRGGLRAPPGCSSYGYEEHVPRVMDVYKAITTRGEDGMDTLTHDDIRDAVRARYGTIAEARGASAPPTEVSCCGGSSSDADSTSCCGGTATATLDMKAQAYGYSAEDTRGVPPGGNLGLRGGQPIAPAGL